MKIIRKIAILLLAVIGFSHCIRASGGQYLLQRTPIFYFEDIKPGNIRIEIADPLLTNENDHWKKTDEIPVWFKNSLEKELTRAGFSVVKTKNSAYDFIIVPEFKFKRSILPLIIYNKFEWEVEILATVKDNKGNVIPLLESTNNLPGYFYRPMVSYTTNLYNMYLIILFGSYFSENNFKELLEKYSRTLAFEMHASERIGSNLERYASKNKPGNSDKPHGNFVHTVVLKNGTKYQNVSTAKTPSSFVIIKQNGETIVVNNNEVTSPR